MHAFQTPQSTLPLVGSPGVKFMLHLTVQIFKGWGIGRQGWLRREAAWQGALILSLLCCPVEHLLPIH